MRRVFLDSLDFEIEMRVSQKSMTGLAVVPVWASSVLGSKSLFLNFCGTHQKSFIPLEQKGDYYTLALSKDEAKNNSDFICHWQNVRNFRSYFWTKCNYKFRTYFLTKCKFRSYFRKKCVFRSYFRKKCKFRTFCQRQMKSILDSKFSKFYC